MSAQTNVIYAMKVEEKSEEEKNIKSYKLQCAGCIYIGESELTMDIHVGIFHSDDFECGVCDVIFENQENLETNLKTCEIFRCRNCGKLEKHYLN